MKSPYHAIDGLIRDGRFEEARSLLNSIPLHSVLRRHAVSLASFARRAGLPVLGIRVLSPYVRPKVKTRTTTRDDEKVEYAGNLVRLGALAEAERLLAEVSAQVPEAWLFRAYARVGQWDYRGSLLPLKRYLQTSDLNPYARLVAEVNLAAALLYERDPDAESLLHRLEAAAQAGNHRLLLGTIRNFSLQAAIARQDWNSVDERLKRARETLEKTGAIEEFFVQKWGAIADYLRFPRQPSRSQNLEIIKVEAFRRRHWESLRDIDYWCASVTRDPRLILKLWFGTPHVSYRKKVEALMGKKFAVPEHFLWEPESAADKIHGGILDSVSGEWGRASASRREGLKLAQQTSRALSLLVSDFYRPFRTAEAHAALFGDAYFNPESSPVRVRQAFSRLGRWLKANRIPLVIERKDEAYRLRARGPLTVRIYREPAGVKTQNLLATLRDHFGVEAFSISQAQKALGKPRRTTLRLLTELTERGELQRQGKLISTRYVVRR